MTARVVELLTAPGAREWAPYLAVLGPRGSGKTRYLGWLEHDLRQRQAAGAPMVVSVDLSRVAFCGESEEDEQLYSLIAGALPARARGAALAADCAPLDRVDEIVIRMLNSSGEGVVLVVDGLDLVSPHFARSLSQRLREYRENRDIYPLYRRLSVVLAGTVSLYSLRREADSAVAVSELVRLPAGDRPAREESVRRRAAELSISLSTAALAALADATGGEPAFLEPVLQAVLREYQPSAGTEHVALDSASVVERYLSDPAWLAANMSILEEVLLASVADDHLKTIVKRLHEGRTAPPAQLTTDIDPYQLLGPVVLTKVAGQPQYLFRNTIVERAFRLYFERTEGASAPRFFVGAETLATVDRQLLGARKRRSGLPPLEKVFRTICGEESRIVGFYVYAGRAPAALSLLLRADRAEGAAAADPEVKLPAEAALRSGGTVVTCGESVVVVAVPLVLGGGATLVLLAKLDKSVLPAELSSLRLMLWTKWVESRREVLGSVALAEVGRSLLAERKAAATAAPRPPDDQVERLLAASRARDRERLAARQATRILRGVVALLLIAVGLAAWKVAPPVIGFVREYWDVIEPFVWMASLAGSVLVVVLGVLGFRLGPEGIRLLLTGALAKWCERRIQRDMERAEEVVRPSAGNPAAAVTGTADSG